MRAEVCRELCVVEFRGFAVTFVEHVFAVATKGGGRAVGDELIQSTSIMLWQCDLRCG